MMPRRLSAFAKAVDGRLIGTDRDFKVVFSDSRRAEKNGLFVCLQGEHYDGHEFAREALNKGAAGLLVARPIAVEAAQIVVPDTLAALQIFATALRRSSRAKVIAVTGSNGKTTTKNLLASIFSQVGPTLATRGNLNNLIGLPLTLARLGEQHQHAVVEMGTNAPGEIASLTAIAEPDVAVVTNVSAAHLKGLGSLDGVASEKGSIFSGLRSDGFAVASADNPWISRWQRTSNCGRWLLFGFDEHADVMALDLTLHSRGADFILVTPLGEAPVSMRMLGRHNVENALAAATIAVGYGLAPGLIARGLTAVAAEPGRLRLQTLDSGARLLDDTYNANPASVAAAVTTAAQLGKDVWLVLGDLAELGAEEVQWHQRLGSDARGYGATRLLALGNLAAEAAKTFGPGAEAFDSVDPLLAALHSRQSSDVVILVKGSRAAHMERVVSALGVAR